MELINSQAPSINARTHKLKRLVQAPNSYFMDVKCPGCFNINTVFSHANTVVTCGSCSQVLCQPTGGKCRLTEGASISTAAIHIRKRFTDRAHVCRLS
ncbi:BQ5605_C003g02458 [Microbotryum silenes-dioicae]|uniref:40S ribosomal protein S27 n=1 Tax=Microbotryum silenes-dioicae TaxID=796604 RepID=A0A2X0M1L6_9BASI|nr:BQ5605_C003g02458 [Microbotryum silenes-dioicae]